MEAYQVFLVLVSFIAGILFYTVRTNLRRKASRHVFPHDWKCPECGSGPGKKCLEYDWNEHVVFETALFHKSRFLAADQENAIREAARVSRAINQYEQ